jgi:Tat protein secretion system quality control protein TatD with DNase activity
MGPVKGEDNTPVTVLQSIDTIATLRQMDEFELRDQVRTNFRTLFGI